jgi:hypothetical protein
VLLGAVYGLRSVIGALSLCLIAVVSACTSAGGNVTPEGTSRALVVATGRLVGTLLIAPPFRPPTASVEPCSSTAATN